jgi:hypothetical protein
MTPHKGTGLYAGSPTWAAPATTPRATGEPAVHRVRPITRGSLRRIHPGLEVEQRPLRGEQDAQPA